MAADTHLLILVSASLLIGPPYMAWVECSRGGDSNVPHYHDVAFIESPQYSVALPGDSVYFNCRTNLPASLENITWLHNGKPLPWKLTTGGDLTFKVSTDVKVYSKQEGTYQCVGGAQGSRFRVASQEADLSIAKLEDFTGTLKDDLIEVYEGNDIVVPCQVPKSVPPAFVQFVRNGELLVDSNGNVNLINGDTLLLTNVTTDLSGNYSCEVTNHITNQRKSAPNKIILTIKPATKNEKSRLIHRPQDNYEVNIGEKVAIPCIASGVPKPDIVWTRSDSQSNETSSLNVQGGILSLENANKNQSGNYMCTVFNGARRFVRKTHVLVVTPPIFLSKTANFVATPEGDVLRLPCKASGSPKPVIEWRINGFPVKEFGASVNPNTGDLVISSAKGEIHSGFYQCFATNKAGQIVSKSFAQVGDSILSNSDDYDAFDEVESVRDFQGHAITKPTKPNVTQVSAESVVIQWKLKPLEGEDANKPLVPVKFYKIQFREFLSASGDGSSKRRSAWHTLDEVIGADARAFEILGLHTDRRYRFRVVVVFENNDSRQSPLSHKFKMSTRSNASTLSPKPQKPGGSPSLTDVRPLSPTSLRLGWVLLNSNSNDEIEGYFIYYKPSVSDEKYKKITILGATSHSFIIYGLIPGTEYDLKMQAFNLAGASPFSNVTRQTTNPLPPVTSAEVSENQEIRRLEEDSKTKEERNDYVVKYLTLGGVLAGCLIILMLVCTLFNFCQRRKTTGSKSINQMTEIQDKYADTAVQISNHQSFSNLDPSLASRQSLAPHSRTENAHPAVRSHSQSLTKDIAGSSSHFEMTLLPDPASVSVIANGTGNTVTSSLARLGHSSHSNVRHHSVSDSMFSSAELNSLGHEEYNDEPRSWRRSRRSEESFI